MIGVEWFDIEAVDVLPKVIWQQVYAVAKLEGKVPVVLYEDDHVNLPGGKPEGDESIDETIRRELEEELNCRVLSWKPLGYQKLSEPGIIEPIYQLRVYAELEKIGKFEKDPDGGVVGYELITLDELNNKINYGNVGSRLMHLVEAEF